jgi:3-oxoacyl-(acyl-carrier-protein) synthase
LNVKRVYIAGAGIISPLGRGLVATEKALLENRSAVRPLKLFPLLQGSPLPTGQVSGLDEPGPLPRTHRLAYDAALQATAGFGKPPDALILGTTTGGILTTEQLLRDREQEKDLYRYHGLHSVAEYLALKLSCTGPVLTVSTACSSGAVALTLALEMLRSGRAKNILAGGVDSLCRLTYFGFHSLQLVDKGGCRPLDVRRRGMALAEGAAMLLLTTEKPSSPLAELAGAGLTCDAHHPAAPHPEGKGALKAMQAALLDAGLDPGDIDYINFHGTGTPENDLAEAKAVHSLFTSPPPVSSIKGATGHSLAAAGAIEAVVAAIAVAKNLMPANTGFQEPDPELDLIPLQEPANRPTHAVLSNSFGFGGNNGSLIITSPEKFPPPPGRRPGTGLAIFGYSCLTGAGDTGATMAGIQSGMPIAGTVANDTISRDLPPGLIRRLKRLPRMALSLAVNAHRESGFEEKPMSIFMGTGWGALSETYDFLTRLTKSDEQFPSPTDFVGSVHNSPASQAAILFGATGVNITTSGGDYSFEQALISAELLLGDTDKTALVLGADEGHEPLSPLLDASIRPETRLADGGGGLYLGRQRKGAKCCVRVPFYQSGLTDDAMPALMDSLGGQRKLQEEYALVLAGLPAAARENGERQLQRFMTLSALAVPVIRYRQYTGEFASASAAAAVMAVSFLETGLVPGALLKGGDLTLAGKRTKILVLGLGPCLSAMEFSRP